MASFTPGSVRGRKVRRSFNFSASMASSHASASSQTESSLEPMKRTVLDLDSRFFPIGVKPGDLIEFKGPAGSGKTFTLTYLLARFLFVYPTKMAVLIDTSHHFNLQNLVSILTHLDSEISFSDLETVKNMNRSATQTPPSAKLISYLQRLFVIKCFTTEDFLMNFRPLPEKSHMEKLLLVNPSVSLLLIDSIDALSHIPDELLQDNRSIVDLIRTSIRPTATPAICIRNFSDDFGGAFPDSRRAESPNSQIRQPSYNPIYIDEGMFTQTLSLVALTPQPLTQGQLMYKPFLRRTRQEEGQGVYNENLRSESVAYLRSRSRHGNPNPAGSSIGGMRNHRVKFSIFSGMLWVCEDKEAGAGK